ncbi:MAG: TIGR03936 family radical SAM-associated protein [Planctomycetales bacterium]|nr:TIGR03936 family radical SAM-associated protein [Planctomycetales bacterium]
MDLQRLRIRFTKEGDLRLISHRDLVRTMERLFRRADVPLAMSEGFHPKVRMMFPSALALGIAGLDELMEVHLAQPLGGQETHARLSRCAPPGLTIRSVEVLPVGAPKTRVGRATYQVQVPIDRQSQVQSAVEQLLASARPTVQRSGADGEFDLRMEMDQLQLADDALSFRLRIRQEGSVRPREVLAALDAADLETQGFPLSRTAVEVA